MGRKKIIIHALENYFEDRTVCGISVHGEHTSNDKKIVDCKECRKLCGLKPLKSKS